MSEKRKTINIPESLYNRFTDQAKPLENFPEILKRIIEEAEKYRPIKELILDQEHYTDAALKERLIEIVTRNEAQKERKTV